MTYRGRIEHGVVVWGDADNLPEGAELEVSVVSAPPPRCVGKSLEKLAGAAA